MKAALEAAEASFKNMVNLDTFLRDPAPEPTNDRGPKFVLRARTLRNDRRSGSWDLDLFVEIDAFAVLGDD